MKATSLAVTAMAMACSIVTASVAADHSPTGAEKTHQPTLQSSPEYQEAEDQFRKYQQAYDRGDAKILASFYADDIDYIDQDGLEVKGRGEMEKLFMENFQANPGAKIAITIEEVKPLTPDVQVNRGVATVTATSGLTESTRYAAVLAKKNDGWQICQLTETAAPAPTASSELHALKWLIGNWENKDADQTVETKVEWAEIKISWCAHPNSRMRKARQTAGRLSDGIRTARRFAPGFLIAMAASENRAGLMTAGIG